MNWIRANYDRALALAGAVFLLLCSISILLSAASFNEKFRAAQNAQRPKTAPGAGNAPELTAGLEELQTPPQWTLSGPSGLFVPEKHFIDANGQPATLKTALLHPPVPNEWLEEFGLPITESDVLTQDPDDDGFTNLDEWQGHTNPTLKDFHPPYVTKLKLNSFAQETFPLIFSSSMGDTYAINSTDLRLPTQFLKVGDMIAGTKYKITGYQEKSDTDKYGTTIDVSELTLEEVDNHDVVTLVKEKPATSPEAVATFIYSWGGSEQIFSVKKNQEFSLRPLAEIKYKLLEVQPDKAIIGSSRIGTTARGTARRNSPDGR